MISVQCHHISQKCDTGGSIEQFTTNDGFKVMAYAKYSVCVTCVVRDNAVREFRNPCHNYEIVGLMMWAIIQDT